jgi:hypothetical protein
MHDNQFVERLDGVEPQWHEDWWDGPLSGVARWHERDFWFRPAIVAELDELPRLYELVDLPPSAMAKVRATHLDFERLVGTHYCEHLDPAERRLAPGAGHAKFYARYPPETFDNYDDHFVVGQFEMPRRQRAR